MANMAKAARAPSSAGLAREGARRAEEADERKSALHAVEGGKRRGIGQVDIPMLTILLVLLLFGLVMLFSASYPSGHLRRGDSYEFIRSQIMFAVIGLAGMVFASFVDYRILRKFAKPLMVLAFMLLVIVLFMPAKNDAHRWIWLNTSMTQGFQPSEVAKFALILLFARMIAAGQDGIRTLRYGMVPYMAILGAVAVLLMLEPHISCTIQVIGIGLVMLFAGGAAVWWFVVGLSAVGGAGYLLITQFSEYLPAYALNRIQVWLDLDNAPARLAHQTVQSLIAVGSGGLAGRGIGRSVQKFLYLPEVYNDYIYAIVCEELGMLGALAVIVLFMALLVRGIIIALRARDKFGAMLVIGITAQLAIQAFLHIAVNLNAIPATGISLPFFSYGGTSLCMLLGEMGVVLSVSRKAKPAASRAGQPGQGEAAPADSKAAGASA